MVDFAVEANLRIDDDSNVCQWQEPLIFPKRKIFGYLPFSSLAGALGQSSTFFDGAFCIVRLSTTRPSPSYLLLSQGTETSYCLTPCQCSDVYNFFFHRSMHPKILLMPRSNRLVRLVVTYRWQLQFASDNISIPQG